MKALIEPLVSTADDVGDGRAVAPTRYHVKTPVAICLSSLQRRRNDFNIAGGEHFMRVGLCIS